MRVIIVEVKHGHFFIRFDTKSSEFQRALVYFKTAIKAEDRKWIQERRLWGVRGSEENFARLAKLFSNFEHEALACQSQLPLGTDEEWENPFDGTV